MQRLNLKLNDKIFEKEANSIICILLYMNCYQMLHTTTQKTIFLYFEIDLYCCHNDNINCSMVPVKKNYVPFLHSALSKPNASNKVR